jgi:hypothetical protein
MKHEAGGCESWGGQIAISIDDIRSHRVLIFCPFLFLPFTKPLITFKRGGLKIFWDSQTHGLGGPQKPAVLVFFNSVWLASTGRATPETHHQARLAQTDSRLCLLVCPCRKREGGARASRCASSRYLLGGERKSSRQQAKSTLTKPVVTAVELQAPGDH